MISLDSYDETELFKYELEALKASEVPGWQEEAIKLIRQSRFDTPELELNRLRMLEVLTPTREDLLDHAIKGVLSGGLDIRSVVKYIQQLLLDPSIKPQLIQSFKSYYNLKTDLQAEEGIKEWIEMLWNAPSDNYSQRAPLIKMLMAQALEIQDIYRATHHVFLHAQQSSWIIFPDLVKELVRINNPEQNIHQFKFLRLPSLERPWDITHYSEADDVYDHEEETNLDLISADGYFFHNERYESALDFLSFNQNISDPSEKVLESAIQSFYPEIPLEKSSFYAKKIIEQTQDDPSQIGNLFVLCIPKEKSLEIQYRAHPFGEPCECHPDSSPIEILEQLQSGILSEETECYFDECPQYRIFAPALTIENGVKSYLLTTEKAFCKTLKERIREIVQEIHSSFASNWSDQLLLS